MSELVSVIIPIYNISQYLNRCIDSVRNQTYRNLQIILVDDGSTDESPQICDSYSAMDDRIEVIHKPNGGLVSARKAGLQATRGKYIGYVDGDDWIEPELYERMLKEMEDSQVDLVETDVFFDMGKETVLKKNSISYGIYEATEIIPTMLCDDDFNTCSLQPYVWSKLFRRELLEQVQYQVDNRIRVGEDAAVTYAYILLCKKVSRIPYVGYHYVQRHESMVHTICKQEWTPNLALIGGLKECFCKNKYANVLLKQLNQYAKMIFMLRDIAYFDQKQPKQILSPFGGVPMNGKVIVYSAGSVGQSVYNYLKSMKSVEVVNWVDRECKKYQQMNLTVQAPESIMDKGYETATIIIAINNRRTVAGIRNWLIENGVKEASILSLTDEFVSMDFLGTITANEIGGFHDK